MRLTLRFAVLLAITFILTSFAFPAYFHGDYPHAAGPSFDKDVSKLYQREIEQAQPAIVLLGDSILTKSVDVTAFQEQLGLPTYKLDIPGSSSALWYLVIKSNIVKAEPAPRGWVIVFRDTLLTAPAFRTTGPYFGLIDKFASPDDSLLMKRAYLAQLSPMQMALEMFFPLYTYRTNLRDAMDTGLRPALPGLLGCDAACADDSLTFVLGDIQPDIFAASILQAEQILYTPGQLDFAAQVDQSFLPEIIRLAQERGIQLVFVRAPTNLFPNPADEPAGLKQYMADLNAYLTEQNILMLDLSRIQGIGPAQFSDPHHMTLEGKAIFTSVLAETLKSYIH